MICGGHDSFVYDYSAVPVCLVLTDYRPPESLHNFLRPHQHINHSFECCPDGALQHIFVDFMNDTDNPVFTAETNFAAENSETAAASAKSIAR